MSATDRPADPLPPEVVEHVARQAMRRSHVLGEVSFDEATPQARDIYLKNARDYLSDALAHPAFAAWYIAPFEKAVNSVIQEHVARGESVEYPREGAFGGRAVTTSKRGDLCDLRDDVRRTFNRLLTAPRAATEGET